MIGLRTSRRGAMAKPVNVGLVDSNTPGGQQPNVSGASGYTLTFSDEFQSGSLNTGKWIPWYPDTSFWNATTPGGHKTNTNEPQGYDASGISFDSDGLVLTMRNTNAAVPELSFSSGMVCSYPAFGQTYGFFEVRMKLPIVTGSWPAFWMDRVDQVWPPEIDWMENFGDSGACEGAYHPPAGQGSTVSSGAEVLGSSIANWHTYGGRWEAGRIRWYYDGTLVFDHQNANVTNQPMYLICNLAGSPSTNPSAGDMPFSAHVDYIRAWSLP